MILENVATGLKSSPGRLAPVNFVEGVCFRDDMGGKVRGGFNSNKKHSWMRMPFNIARTVASLCRGSRSV